jgi:hypothetical protein
MSETARFRYVQARLQSRHGDRADDLVWRRLQSTCDLANYLQAAQQTTLRRWVTGLHSKHSSHEIEFMLRRHYRDYVDEVAHWLPTRWTGSVQMLKRVPDLPALQHLMAGESIPAWMFDDPELNAFASENQGSRLEAIQNSDLAWLAEGWQQDRALVDSWLDYWRSKWPSAPRLTGGLDHLARLMQEHIQTQYENPVPAGDQRGTLTRKLTGVFRRYSFQPAATVAHLGLVALDLEKLRGDLVSRQLYVETAVAAT